MSFGWQVHTVARILLFFITNVLPTVHPATNLKQIRMQENIGFITAMLLKSQNYITREQKGKFDKHPNVWRMTK